MFGKVMRCRALGLLCLVVHVGILGTPTVKPITCVAGSCELGQPTSVTCQFNTDIRASKLDFYVTQDNNNYEKSVVMCTWRPEEELYCIIRSGFQVDTKKVNNLANIEIPSCQLDKLGWYKCHVIGEVDVSTEGCNLTVKDAEKNTSPASAEGENDPSDVYIRVGVYTFLFILGFIVCVVLVVRLSSNRNSPQQRNTSGDAVNASNIPIDNPDETCNLVRIRSTSDAENSVRFRRTFKSVQTQISLQMSNINQATQTSILDIFKKDPYLYRDAETQTTQVFNMEVYRRSRIYSHGFTRTMPSPQKGNPIAKSKRLADSR